MSRIKSILVGGIAMGFVISMAASANAQLFRRSESRERYQSPQYQGQIQYRDEGQSQFRDQTREQGQTQYRGETRNEGSDRYSSMHSRNRRISTVIGATARGPNGEYLGRIEDLVASEGGCIDYAIVSFSGIPGLGGRVAAIPWMLADLDMAQRVVTLDIERDRIREAPIFFDRNNWPDLYNREWTERVSDFFEVEVASDMRDDDVDRDRSGRTARSRSQDRDRFDSRSYNRPDSEQGRDRLDSQSRRGSERDRDGEYRSRRSQDDEGDDRGDSPRSRSSSKRDQGDDDSDRNASRRSSDSNPSDDDDDSDKDSEKKESNKKDSKKDKSDESDDSDDSKVDQPK